jgi:cell volume regulation protein A
MAVPDMLLLIGGILLAGFGGMLFFQRTGIPDLLALIALGVLLGPVLQVVDPEQYRSAAPYFGAFALMMILFEGGLDLHFSKVISQSGKAMLLLFFSFSLSMMAIAYLASVITGMDLLHSMMLGGILANTSGPIIIPIVARLDVNADVKTMVSLESAMSDALSVIVVVTLLNLGETGTIQAGLVGQELLRSFLIALGVALVLGVIWLRMLDMLRDRPFSYVVTLAFLLLIQGGIEHIGGSGAIATLLFGMVLANGDAIAALFGKRVKSRMEQSFRSGNLDLDEGIKHFHAELTFFVRTFFFVYLGLLFNVQGTGLVFWTLSGAMLVAIVLTRLVSVSIIRTLFTFQRGDGVILWTMLPRGLAAAALAALPVSEGIAGTETFPSYAFMVIILTNAMMTLSLFLRQRVKKRGHP